MPPKISAIKVRAVVLYCGQGMAHVVEIWAAGNTTDVPSSICILDLGGHGKTKNPNAKNNTVNYVKDRLAAIAAARNGPAPIDLVLISHADSDHWSMLDPLAEELRMYSIPIQIGKFLYGGLAAGWSSAGKAAMAKLAQRAQLPPKVIALGDDRSDLRTNTANSLGDYRNVTFRVLITNLTSASFSEKNGSSAAIAVTAMGSSFVFPGDATRETIAKMNHLLEKAGVTKWSPQCLMMSVPHHGADATFRGGTDKVNPDHKIGENFIDVMQPTSIAASAGYDNQFLHPYATVLKTLAKYSLQPDWPQHNYVEYDPALDHWWEEQDTKQGVFSTVTAFKAPPATANPWFQAALKTIDGVDYVERSIGRVGQPPVWRELVRAP